MLPGRLLDPASNGGTRGMIVVRRSLGAKAPSEGGDRIRLTDRCGGTYLLRVGEDRCSARTPALASSSSAFLFSQQQLPGSRARSFAAARAAVRRSPAA